MTDKSGKLSTFQDFTFDINYSGTQSQLTSVVLGDVRTKLNSTLTKYKFVSDELVSVLDKVAYKSTDLISVNNADYNLVIGLSQSSGTQSAGLSQSGGTQSGGTQSGR